MIPLTDFSSPADLKSWVRPFLDHVGGAGAREHDSFQERVRDPLQTVETRREDAEKHVEDEGESGDGDGDENEEHQPENYVEEVFDGSHVNLSA